MNTTMEIMLVLLCQCGLCQDLYNYMPELSGKRAIAPAPVFEEGQERSVGGGGTGTVVTKECENKDLAKEFLAFAKLSEEGISSVWEILGFDPVNTDCLG